VGIADQLTAAVPHDPLVRAIRAQGLLSAGDPDEALSEARRAVELDPQNAFAHRLLGLAAWRAGKLSLAQESLQRAVALSAGDGRASADYAWFMAQERGPRLAEEAAQQAVQADPASSTAWAALGLVQYRLHRRGEAEESLRHALRLDPNDIYAQSAMVVLLQDKRRDDQAVALAHLLEEQPGAEDFVAAVRREAKNRQIDKMLVERQAMPTPGDDDSPHRWAMWVMMALLTLAALCLLFLSNSAIAGGAFLITAFLLLWCLRRVFE
jgi:Tfp pilus assembly protein PilF